MKIHYQDWKNAQIEIKDFITTLEKELSKYCGFKMTFPLRNQTEDLIMDTLIMDAHANFSVKIPELTEDIAITILEPLSKILERSINENEKLDVKNIQTIARDLSLSYIFDGYNDMADSQQYNVIEIVNELKNIGAKTYEGQPVDIGVIYCNDDKILEEIQKLNIDIILIPERKPINLFFLEEKPLLRLIDNKSLAVAIDNNFNVFAIVRKRPGSKSLSSILESQYNEWTINDAMRTTSRFLTESFKENL
ncbi:MAG: hypothetical protein ACYDEJ_17260 [Desulfitobacteriaceae bacterium]